MPLKVIPLKSPHEIVDVVRELERGVIGDQVTDAILVYRMKPKDENEKGRIVRYWFGEDSTIMCLGLARHMTDVIAEWIYQESYLLDEDYEDEE